VDTHHYLWSCLVMASLKSFLYGVAPILGTTGAALYERQRALVNLKALESAPGRGPGSGVPLTAYNVAATIISVLAAENLAEVDERVVSLINAPPRLIGEGAHNRAAWEKAGSPTFCTAVAAVLAGGPMPWPMEGKRPVHAIRITRAWLGELVSSPSGANPTSYLSLHPGRYFWPILIVAELRSATLQSLKDFTQGALSQAAAEEDDE
jgi:hypothetical protein